MALNDKSANLDITTRERGKHKSQFKLAPDRSTNEERIQTNRQEKKHVRPFEKKKFFFIIDFSIFVFVQLVKLVVYRNIARTMNCLMQKISLELSMRFAIRQKLD